MPANAMQTIENGTDHASGGGRLVSVDGRPLPLESATLSAAAAGGLARTTLRQVFGNPYNEPLQVLYTMPLPAGGGTVGGYAFRIGKRRITGEVMRREAARQEFERALVEGRAAGLLEQERANLFTQQLGNLPPGRKVFVELTIDQKLAWLAEGMWEWRFPTVCGPRYLGAGGRVPDAGRVTVEVADGALPVPEGGRITVRGRTAGGTWEQEVVVPPAGGEEDGRAVARLCAREAVEDLEIDLAAGARRRDVDAAIERLGLDFGISTRLTSWVAVSDEVDVDPGAPSRRTVVPQELPCGTSAEGLRLRPVLSKGAAHLPTLLFGRTIDEAVSLEAMPLMASSERPSILSAARHWSKRLSGSVLSTTPRQVPGEAAQGGESDERPATARHEGGAAAGLRSFRGRWIDAGLDDVQIIEFEVAGEGLDWRPGDRATLELRDGGMATVAIEVMRGTAIGGIEPGCLVRLALAMDRSRRDAVVAVLLGSGAMRIRIEP